MRVLLLEDEEALNEIAADQIRRRGHEVFSAVSIAEAEALLADSTKGIECLIADHRLPDGPGVALCVKCQHRFPKMAIAVVSACLTVDDREYLETHGIPYWRKPVLYSQVLEKLCAIRKPPPAAPVPPPSAPVLAMPVAEESAQSPRFQAPPPPPEVETDIASPSWPSTYEPKQRLNRATHLETQAPFPGKSAAAENRPSPARRFFSFGRKS